WIWMGRWWCFWTGTARAKTPSGTGVAAEHSIGAPPVKRGRVLSRQASIASRSDTELEPSEYRTRPAVSRWISSQNGVGEAQTRGGISGGSLVGVGSNSSRWTGPLSMHSRALIGGHRTSCANEL